MITEPAVPHSLQMRRLPTHRPGPGAGYPIGHRPSVDLTCRPNIECCRLHVRRRAILPGRQGYLPVHRACRASPSSRRGTKRRRSSITELAFHGIHSSRRTKAPMCPVRFVTYVSGRSIKHLLPAPRAFFYAARNLRALHLLVRGGGHPETAADYQSRAE